MNSRFEPKLRFGESVERVKYDISGVRVRDVTRGAASTIDEITDTSELLEINIERETVFHISDGEVTQAGPLNPGEAIGGEVGQKVALDLDAECFAEVENAANTFDTGDLTALTSSGTPISLTGTTVPQMVTRMPAKLKKRENQTLTNMVMVIDSYGASDVEQYLLSKDINLAESTFVNGYAGPIRGATMYVSEALMGEAVLGLATQPTANDTVTFEGLTFTFVASPSAEGDIDLGADVDATRANLAAALNQGAGAGTDYIAFTGDDLNTLKDLKVTATNDDTADTLTVQAKGTGRLTVSETLTDATDAWDKNFIHAYFGKRGAIDLVVQNMAPVDMRKTDDRRGTNVFSSYLAGIKTFTDGSKKFLDVHIAA